MPHPLLHVLLAMLLATLVASQEDQRHIRPRDRIIQNPVETREDLAELLRAMLDPLGDSFSPDLARVKIGFSGQVFDDAAAEFEGFARPLWGLAPLLAGGGKYKHTSRWIRGFANGVDPNHPEYWGEPVDFDQRFVEMAAVGFALTLAPEQLWQPLSTTQKVNLVTWLSIINTRAINTNNWQFFRILVNVGLRQIGAPYSQPGIEAAFTMIDSFYDKVSGWPSDGVPGTAGSDYYASSFAIPFYSLVYSKVAAEYDPVRAALYRERARKMALDVVHLFAPDGAAIPFGRSLTYRFAVSAFWAAAAYADLELPAPLSWGVVKGLLLRNIRWFTTNPAVFNADGTLTIGWTYPNQFLAEGYNSPQSPYWCLKAFLPLAISANSNFWSAPEEPYPESLLNISSHVLRPAKQVFSHAAGHTFFLTSGQFPSFGMRQIAEKYSKLAYSSAFGFSVPTGAAFIDQHALDSTFALADDDLNERWKVNRRSNNVTISDAGVIEGFWQPWPDVQITTWLIPPSSPSSAFHTRVHRVRTSRKLNTVDGSFALYNQAGPPNLRRPVPGFAASPTTSTPSKEANGIWSSSGEAILVSPAGAVGIIDLLAVKRTGQVQESDSNTNLIEPKTAIPMLRGVVTAGSGEQWFASAVFAVPFEKEGIRPNWVGMWKERPAIPAFVPT